MILPTAACDGGNHSNCSGKVFAGFLGFGPPRVPCPCWCHHIDTTNPKVLVDRVIGYEVGLVNIAAFALLEDSATIQTWARRALERGGYYDRYPQERARMQSSTREET